jgi:nitrous oxidase accessory protein NosD
VTLHGGTGHTMSGNSVPGNGVGVMLQTNTEAAVHGNNIFGNDTVTSSANAGLISNSIYDQDVSGNYWGAGTTSGFAGDVIYDLGSGDLQTLPDAKARFAIALEPMK